MNNLPQTFRQEFPTPNILPPLPHLQCAWVCCPVKSSVKAGMKRTQEVQPGCGGGCSCTLLGRYYGDYLIRLLRVNPASLSTLLPIFRM